MWLSATRCARLSAEESKVDMAGNRQARIDEEVKRVLSDIVAHDVRDDRLSPMTSLTRVSVTTDLKYAKVYVSVLGTPRERSQTIDALRHGAGFIRSQLARRISLRRAPELIFEIDDSVEHGLHIAKLLSDMHGADNGDGGN